MTINNMKFLLFYSSFLLISNNLLEKKTKGGVGRGRRREGLGGGEKGCGPSTRVEDLDI